MMKHLAASRTAAPHERFALALALLLGLAGLAGCDTVPDKLNPFAEEAAAEPETPIETGTVPGEDEPTPNLASVPDRTAPNFSAEQRKALVQGLIAGHVARGGAVVYTTHVELEIAAAVSLRVDLGLAAGER